MIERDKKAGVRSQPSLRGEVGGKSIAAEASLQQVGLPTVTHSDSREDDLLNFEVVAGEAKVSISESSHYTSIPVLSDNLSAYTRDHVRLLVKSLGIDESIIPDGNFIFLPANPEKPIRLIDGNGQALLEDSQTVTSEKFNVGSEQWLAIAYPELHQFGFMVECCDGTKLKAIPFHDEGFEDTEAYGDSWQIVFNKPFASSRKRVQLCFLSAIIENESNEPFPLVDGVRGVKPVVKDWKKKVVPPDRKEQALENLVSGYFGKVVDFFGKRRLVERKLSLLSCKRFSIQVDVNQEELLKLVKDTKPYSVERQSLLIKYLDFERDDSNNSEQLSRHMYLDESAGSYMRDPETR